MGAEGAGAGESDAAAEPERIRAEAPEGNAAAGPELAAPIDGDAQGEGDDAEGSEASADSSCVGEGLDEAGKPEVQVRPLTYSWEQTESELKVYVQFDQHEELSGGVPKENVSVEFGEWNALLIIESPVAGRIPFGLRLADFHRRVVPDMCTYAVRSSRVTLRLTKEEDEHWFNITSRRSAR
ncbi:unnamed protein product [Prorocentrum cordatum]|uniref:CS domain-containing protein n=1 Tax=Prorocentrum cordatum TaxID=2364126 RepID=A0ABN9UEJ7_9DINO|nr:unnamed protein product [Polarella glacialis]